MANGTFAFTRSFQKRLDRKPVKERAAILECVAVLMKNERHPELNVHKMRGTKGIWEAYVNKANRLTFMRNDDELLFRVNCNHDVLRNP